MRKREEKKKHACIYTYMHRERKQNNNINNDNNEANGICKQVVKQWVRT